MIKVKEVSDHSWILITDTNDQVALLSECQDGEYILIDDKKKTRFQDKENIVRFFNQDIFSNVTLESANLETEYFIKGYPVKFDKPYEVDTISDLPLYRKSPISDVHHCAGFYCLKFPKTWVIRFCPKYSTMTKYNYVGPYKTEEQAKQELSKLKKSLRS